MLSGPSPMSALPMFAPASLIMADWCCRNCLRRAEISVLSALSDLSESHAEFRFAVTALKSASSFSVLESAL